MIELSHDEAILFRVLTSFFGGDHVIPNMSVMTVIGGEIPDRHALERVLFRDCAPVDLAQWARKNRCLFTIVNPEHEPRMVIEFFSGFEGSISNVDVEHQRYLLPILRAAGISYCTISDLEFREIIDPGGSLDFFSFLKAKCEALGVTELS